MHGTDWKFLPGKKNACISSKPWIVRWRFYFLKKHKVQWKHRTLVIKREKTLDICKAWPWNVAAPQSAAPIAFACIIPLQDPGISCRISLHTAAAAAAYAIQSAAATTSKKASQPLFGRSLYPSAFCTNTGHKFSGLDAKAQVALLGYYSYG